MTALAVPTWAAVGASAVVVKYSSWGTPQRTEVTITRTTATQLVVTYSTGATTRFSMVRGVEDPCEMNGRDEWTRDRLVATTHPNLALWDAQDAVLQAQQVAKKACSVYTNHPHAAEARAAIEALQAYLETGEFDL